MATVLPAATSHDPRIGVCNGVGASQVTLVAVHALEHAYVTRATCLQRLRHLMEEVQHMHRV